MNYFRVMVACVCPDRVVSVGRMRILDQSAAVRIAESCIAPDPARFRDPWAGPRVRFSVRAYSKATRPATSMSSRAIVRSSGEVGAEDAPRSQAEFFGRPRFRRQFLQYAPVVSVHARFSGFNFSFCGYGAPDLSIVFFAYHTTPPLPGRSGRFKF